ncbi:branched-chain amino acid ABC transporter permease [Oryzobacter telluris]|uniref:branched-chain amino acid ABC transporter permease n=1 Tax=Oryzobacter telluris TaxID=3149179 RepID=UPI00370D7AF0
MLLPQLLITGILTGMVYGLVGVGFTLVLGVGKIANFAYGSLVALGMYFAYVLHEWTGLGPYVALLPGLVLFSLLGLGIAELFEWRARASGEIGELLIGLGVLLTIGGLLAVIFSDNPRTMDAAIQGGWEVFGFVVPWDKLLAGGFTFVLGLSLFLFIRRTRVGRAMRAVAENSQAAALHGVRTPVIRRLAVVISTAIAGISGILVSSFVVLTPEVGTNFLISAFAVVIVGGIGNTIGAVFAGMGVGVIEALSAGYLSSIWTTIVPLVIIFVALMVRPQIEEN